MNSKISVIMPIYNGGRFVEEAVRSVLDQSYENLELIIVNDGSTDDTEEIISSFLDDRITVLKHDTNKGKVAAINLGVKESTGDLIVLFAADDVLPKQSLEKRSQSLSSNAVAFCNFWVCDAKLNKVKLGYRYTESTVFWEQSKRRLLLHNMVGGGTFILRRNLAEKIFPIPETLRFEDWWITFFSLMYAGKIGYLDEPLLLYRIHGNNDNGSLETMKRDSVIKKDFARHSVFYEELALKIDQLEHPDAEEFLAIIAMNECVKRKVVEGGFIPPNREFIRLYGVLEYIRLNMISLEISAVPSMLIGYARKFKMKIGLVFK
ncbi:MAG: glycosyltransferase [Clostridiaceae bacterium]|nr:glycosyltransferase [Clostridiaceae bacterium]